MHRMNHWEPDLENSAKQKGFVPSRLEEQMEESKDWGKIRTTVDFWARARNIQQMEYCSVIKRNKIGLL